jgi:hypothetical protein
MGIQFFKHFSKRLALIDDLNADEGNVIALHHKEYPGKTAPVT